MSGWPKIHKPGNKLRPVVTTIDAPTSKIAAFLVKKFRTFNKYETRSVKNSFELTRLLANEVIDDDHEMVSFDVCSLFPSIPEYEAIIMLKEWVTEQDIELEECEMLCIMIDLVASQKFFQFDNKIYMQLSGVEIGGKISAHLAEIFMSRLEMKFLREPGMPKTYYRYVDDIFAVVKKGESQETLKKLNKAHNAIEFTIEHESEGKIPFLDLMISRSGKKFEYEIYHKPTDLPQCIPRDSHSPMAYKLAAFQFAFHRLYNIPLTSEGFARERQRIYEMAAAHDYTLQEINKVEVKHQRREKREKLTTLASNDTKSKDKKLMLIGYHPPFTEKLKKAARTHGINPIYKSNGSLAQLLINLKDVRPEKIKSGVYQIDCMDCDMKYVGQSRRRVEQRWKEHEAAKRLNHPQKSAIAEHTLNMNHEMGEKKLLREVINVFELDSWESFYIATGDNLLNIEEPLINSNLYLLASNLKN
jgi:hypothetical protein